MAFGPPLPRRYLVGFDPMALPHHFTDVLVLGGGIAGMRAALGIPPELRVLIITKQAIEESNTAYAQGGIAGVLDPEDAFEDHIADTLAAGKGLCDPQAVEVVVREGPDRIRELIDWGTHFDYKNGRIDLTREGGHSHARIAHALGDATGRELTRALIANVRRLRHVRIWQNSLTIDLLTQEGRCCGALVWDAKRGPSLVWCRAMLLATGGAGQLYRESTNPPLATGDGYAMAYRAGAELRDMEFMQFHPTVLYIAGSARFLLTEALRGEGAYLRDRKGVRFMPEAHPDAELAPRDDVSRAITRRMAETRHPCVYLDLSHLDAAYLRNRFPGIDAICRRFDLDFTKDPIPVRPGAHYMLGGVTVDLNGRTTLPGLWAAGEVTSSGLHGANRLASNSLLEGLVFGARAARDIAAELARSPRGPLVVPSVDGLDPLHVREVQPASPGFSPADPAPADPNGLGLDLTDIRESLRALMGREVGIARDAEGLQEARRQVEFWSRYVLPIVFDQPEGWTLQNMLIVAQLMIASASAREESRGVHYRTDFPKPSDTWLKRVTLRRPLLENEPPPAIWVTGNIGSEISSFTPTVADPTEAGTPSTL
ncbi:L-aspartate oxidase [Isosphaera pallida ATCC 43644]|uniref:L-aspartate oxidase n=1 Tax=Isosphaera pallida (strain ATCC 43644 / DSM 9630 / IS1B) TaxID=575540 RepID=E8R403_ISOPI|nr:L-aspartate oxidase [Isosphaera pallida]ADV63733.1 L-aspartate oxidase [Isosphaera pallida ATCC 43644]